MEQTDKSQLNNGSVIGHVDPGDLALNLKSYSNQVQKNHASLSRTLVRKKKQNSPERYAATIKTKRMVDFVWDSVYSISVLKSGKSWTESAERVLLWQGSLEL